MSHGHVMWVSREAAFRSTDDWKDTTMPSAISPPKAVLGIDVGKSSHWACLVTREGEVALNRRVRNSEGDLDGLFSQVACDTIVVVDQCRNIGLLAISRARLAGLGVAYLPGLAAHQAARLFAGDAKTDERDALVIAKTALGTSISSVSASRQGNRRLKNLLIFSCNSLVRSENRFGEYYRACRGRGMCHGEALKAVARKRLKVIYAIMRDKVPYSA